MTIASEITRLQTAKACLKASIEAKGVTVPSNLTLEDYYACVDSIKAMKTRIKYLVVGGGGSGNWTGGGGGGAVCEGYSEITDNILNIVVGTGGVMTNYQTACSGGYSQICGLICANGGQGGSYGGQGGTSGSGCSGYGGSFEEGGGGGGATGNGSGCNGGAGKKGYGGGGGGWSNSARHSQASDGGGQGGGPYSCRRCPVYGCPATNYGGGGGGGYGAASNVYLTGGAGCQGVVDICYTLDGTYGITSATGGDCCFTCDGYCVHRFTQDGTFTIVS